MKDTPARPNGPERIEVGRDDGDEGISWQEFARQPPATVGLTATLARTYVHFGEPAVT
jgi:hypothetical protein